MDICSRAFRDVFLCCAREKLVIPQNTHRSQSDATHSRVFILSHPSRTLLWGNWAMHRQPGLQSSLCLEPHWNYMGGNFHLHGTEGIGSCLLGPWLLLKVPPPQPPQERCVAISHVGAAPSLPTNERYLLSNPESPQKLYINPIQGIKGV